MRDEFSFESIRSTEFGVNVSSARAGQTSYLVPSDRSVQEALKQVLLATVADLEPPDGVWTPYEISEKYNSEDKLRANSSDEEMSSVRAMYEEEGWEINASALSDPSKVAYYFGIFRDTSNRKLVGVRQATQFKGAFKGRFLSFIDDTLKMVTDRVFKLGELCT